MEQKIKKQRMSIYFPPDLLESLRESAREHKRSFNQEVLFILQKEVDFHKWDTLAEERNRQLELEALTALAHAKPGEFRALSKKYNAHFQSRAEVKEILDRLMNLYKEEEQEHVTDDPRHD